MRVTSGVLSHPPADGIEHDKLFASVFPDEWAALKDTLKDNAEPPQQPSGGQAPGKHDPDTPSLRGGQESEATAPQGMVAAAKLAEARVSAKERAKDLLNFNPGMSFVVPDTWCTQALEIALNGQQAHGQSGRCVAVFDPKADDDARTHPGQTCIVDIPTT